jgi:hypothetical protein
MKGCAFMDCKLCKEDVTQFLHFNICDNIVCDSCYQELSFLKKVGIEWYELISIDEVMYSKCVGNGNVWKINN